MYICTWSCLVTDWLKYPKNFVNWIHKSALDHCEVFNHITYYKSLSNFMSISIFSFFLFLVVLINILVVFHSYFIAVMGITRFCSAWDMGNECQFLDFPDHDRIYRACIMTCSKDACNLSRRIMISLYSMMIILYIVIYFYFNTIY